MEFNGVSPQTLFTSKELIEVAESSRQVLRTVIEKGIIVPKKRKIESLGNREIMMFDSYDLLTLRVVETLMEMGKKVDKKSKHSDETVVDIFKKNNNDTYKVIEQSKQKMIDEINERAKRVDFFEIAHSFDISTYNGKAFDLKDVYDGETFSDGILMKLGPIIKLLKENQTYEEDKYISELKHCFGYGADDIYYYLKMTLAVLKSDELFTKKLSEFYSDEQISNLEIILKGIIDKITTESFSEEYYSRFAKICEKALPNIPKVKISAKESEALTDKVYQNIIDYFYPEEDTDSDDDYIRDYPIEYPKYVVLLSLLNPKGKLAKKIDDIGGDGTSQKIKSIATNITEQLVLPYDKKLEKIIEENGDDPVITIELVAKAYIEFVAEMNKGIFSKEKFLEMAKDGLDKLTLDFKSVEWTRTFPESYWQYIKEKLLTEAEGIYKQRREI